MNLVDKQVRWPKDDSLKDVNKQFSISVAVVVWKLLNRYGEKKV